ncbi:hypothetical protein GDO86_004159 [Hymenochirus boettgeri]|uniref:Uncharacterized protein n=1 Tax=Hymenochirus boettgeri TaxID=247094 RepID=A0A8T2KCA5_9PIPI|nr:hypothetical protein GDO86_004159 [Hymenochirus boettgeri]
MLHYISLSFKFLNVPIFDILDLFVNFRKEKNKPVKQAARLFNSRGCVFTLQRFSHKNRLIYRERQENIICINFHKTQHS